MTHELLRPALVALALAGCSAPPRADEVASRGAPSDSASKGAAMTEASLPDGILLEFAAPSTKQRWRVAEDGRWLVTAPDGTESERAPISREEAGANRLSPRALDRIRAALTEVRFASLPDSVPGSSQLPPNTRVADGDPLGHIKYVITARAGSVKRVSVDADARYAPSFGVLEPLFRVLDGEALGIWQLR